MAAGMRVIGLTTTHDAGDLPDVKAVLPDLVGISVRQDETGLVLVINN